MAFKAQGRNQVMSEINVTPLVDVMLVLLIIFMVTAPMLQEGVSVELPEVKGTPLAHTQTIEHIILSVSKDGATFMNEAQVSMEDLPEKVLAEVKKDKRREVYLRADKSVPYGTVVQIMGALRNAGIQNLGMITTPSEGAGTSQ